MGFVGLALLLGVMGLGQRAADTKTPATQAQAEAPLPPVGELMLEVEKNEDALDKARQNYTYHVHTESVDLDGKGDVKKTQTEDAESLRIDGVLVDKVVAKNGKPLTPEEAQKESDRIDKEVAKEKERREKLKNEGKPSDSNGHEELTLSRILQLGTFSNERRVELHGRPTIVVDYTGDPNAKTRTRFEAVFRDLVGTIWVDEKDHAIVQLQGHFLNDFRVGGGLVADVKKGSSFSATFTKVNDEAWLLEDAEGQGSIRVLLFVGFHGRFRMTASEYKKFRTTTTIIPSDRVIGEDGKPVEDGAAGPKP